MFPLSIVSRSVTFSRPLLINKQFLSSALVNKDPPIKLFTLAMIFENNQMLLGWKKKGFGKGKWISFGGKVEAGESAKDGAARELNEESSLVADLDSMKQIGVFTAEVTGDPVLMEVHIFRVNSYTGQPTESDEMKPGWHDVDNLPYDEMWSDNRVWFPQMFKGTYFNSYYKYKQDTLVEHKTKEYNSEEDLLADQQFGSRMWENVRAHEETTDK